jgi:hypothetical protein
MFIMQFVKAFLTHDIADVEREVMMPLEKLIPWRDDISKILEQHVQGLTRRLSIAPYAMQNQVCACIISRSLFSGVEGVTVTNDRLIVLHS